MQVELMNYIVAAVGDWNKEIFDKVSKRQRGNWYFCSIPSELDDLLERVAPEYIFFPHWSWIVSDEIIEKYECICFHMTDLPFGRGGSPLQNLIVRGYEDTILTALRMEGGVDTGPIYYKKPLSLHGPAHDIYKRAGRLCWGMISDFIKENPNPVPQQGTTTNFKRRTPEQSQIPESLSLEDIYNYIRMLDAPGYPKAFSEMGEYKLEFEGSEYIDVKLTAKVNFIRRED